MDKNETFQIVLFVLGYSTVLSIGIAWVVRWRFRQIGDRVSRLRDSLARNNMETVEWVNSLGEYLGPRLRDIENRVGLTSAGSAPQPPDQLLELDVISDKPLSTRERNTLLAIIAVLCKDAGYDPTKPAKTAGLIKNTAVAMGIKIGESTIESHLKKIPDALESRTD